jgi:hypothetical protein
MASAVVAVSGVPWDCAPASDDDTNTTTKVTIGRARMLTPAGLWIEQSCERSQAADTNEHSTGSSGVTICFV